MLDPGVSIRQKNIDDKPNVPPRTPATRKPNIYCVVRPNVGVNWRSLPSVKRRRPHKVIKVKD